MKKVIVIVILLLMINSCGYRVIGIHEDKDNNKYTVYYRVVGYQYVNEEDFPNYDLAKSYADGLETDWDE